MIIYLIKNDIIKKTFLPIAAKGSFWIKDIDDNNEEVNLISIEADNNEWFFISNDNVYCFDSNNKKVPRKKVENYQFVTLKNGNSYIQLYTTPLIDNTFKYYSIKDLEGNLSIGKDKQNIISYNYDTIGSEGYIVCKKTYFVLQQINSKVGIYVNNVKLLDKHVLCNGDIIFIAGLRMIVFINKDCCCLIINNPNNLVSVKLKEIGKPSYNNPFNSNEDGYEALGGEKEFFHRKPRFSQVIRNYEVNIDSPPNASGENKMPAILVYGPMLTTSLMSFMYGYNAIQAIMNNPNDIRAAIFPVIMCVSMLSGTLLWPNVMRAYNKKKAKEYEALRQKKYGEYINQIRENINKEMFSQKQILIDNNPSLEEAKKTILEKNMNLWQKRVNDEDFLTVNLGIGNIPMSISIKYPEKHFSMEEDPLQSTAISLGDEQKILDNVPIPYSFRDNKLVGIIGNTRVAVAYLETLLLQLIAYHGYDNLKIVIMTNEDNQNYWSELKKLPHCWNNEKSLRFFSSNMDEYKEVCYYLDSIYTRRKDEKKSEDVNYNPYYLIISDCIKSIRNFEIVKQILNEPINYGFGMILLDDRVSNIPDQFQNFINIQEGYGEMFRTVLNSIPVKFVPNFQYPIELNKCIETLSDIPIEFTNDEVGIMPDKVSFLEMYQVGKIEQLNIEKRWADSNPMLSLKAPVGIGKSGERISIDLHEKYHGPHGLIAGMTGSGKSEFIIDYILSMAVNYHPYEVQFILIDYKGGGLAGAFENSITGVKLPHLVGTITNLDSNEIKRSLASIESELKRRQRVFNEAREISGESTIDIYKYQKMYREGIVKEPISHLFVISDEFAELKTQEPEFMDQLISTARIGRSLGVHLILATQKPSGVVNAQIWSNTRFRVCLKVQDTGDSNEVIKKPDAAYLTRPGRFYFQVGTDELFTLGQGAYCGSPYIPTETIKREVDKSIQVINNNGFPLKTIDEDKKEVVVESKGEELLNVVTYLYELGKKNNIVTKPLWMPKMPGIISVENIKKLYNYTPERFNFTPVIGLYDDPNNQLQGLANINITGDGNTIIYGMSGSGEDLLLRTIVYSLCVEHSPEEVNIYAIDCGSETMGLLKKLPHVGDVAYSTDSEKIVNLLKLVSEQINYRKKLFVEYNGDYNTYIKNSGKTLPAIVVIINNFDNFKESYEALEDVIKTLSRDSIKYGIYFILTTVSTNGVRSTIKQNFNNLISLQLNDNTAYSYIFGNIKKLEPSKILGRGLIKLDQVYEFQTASFCEEENFVSYINQLAEQFNQVYPNMNAKGIPILPEVVTVNDLVNNQSSLKNYPVGIDKNTLEVVTYNFDSDSIELVLAQDDDMIPVAISPMLSLLSKFSTLVVFDPKSVLIPSNEYTYVNNDFDSMIEKICNIQDTTHTYCCVIVDLDNFIKKVSEDTKKLLDQFFGLCKDENKHIRFIFAGTSDMIKPHEYDTWYKPNVNNKEGIWIGNGIGDQNVIKIDNGYKLGKEKLTKEFAFVNKKGNNYLVKIMNLMIDNN